MAVNGGTLVNKEAYYYYRKSLPTPCTLLLSSQVSGLSDFEVWQSHGLQNREFWGKEVTTWSKARWARAGSALAIPSSQRGEENRALLGALIGIFLIFRITR